MGSHELVSRPLSIFAGRGRLGSMPLRREHSGAGCRKHATIAGGQGRDRSVTPRVIAKLGVDQGTGQNNFPHLQVLFFFLTIL